MAEDSSARGELEVAATIQQRILLVRGRQVMVDSDLAEMYGVETKRLVEQVKRNVDRFPEDFMCSPSRASRCCRVCCAASGRWP